jgi:hypothetical protein
LAGIFGGDEVCNTLVILKINLVKNKPLLGLYTAKHWLSAKIAKSPDSFG